MITRREFGKLTVAAIALPRTLQAQTIKGVRLGVQTYSFRDLPRNPATDAVDTVITAMKACELTECELFAPQVEPKFDVRAGQGASPRSSQSENARDDLRKWRLTTSLDHFRRVGRKFADAGITVYAYNYSPDASFTDDEIDRGFEMARALGAQILTASTTLDVAKRIVPLAGKHNMIVAMHGHSQVDDPNQFATPESFAAAIKLSRRFKVNLDIGHFTAGGFDAVDYIRQHHANITNLHLKDRKKHQGDNVPWGQGDTPIRDVLRLLSSEQWPIRAYIEYEYRGTGTPVDEVKKCMEFVKESLG
jgi:sugar phosphate isomerase/epimerase